MKKYKKIFIVIVIMIAAMIVLITSLVFFYKNTKSNNPFTEGMGNKISCFPMTEPQVNILSPNGGEVYTAGQEVEIKWSKCNVPDFDDSVTIVLKYVKDNTNNDVFSFEATNDGSTMMTLPANSLFNKKNYQFGNFYSIYMETHGANGEESSYLKAVSDNKFTINQAVNAEDVELDTGSILTLPVNTEKVDSQGLNTIPVFSGTVVLKALADSWSLPTDDLYFWFRYTDPLNPGEMTITPPSDFNGFYNPDDTERANINQEVDAFPPGQNFYVKACVGDAKNMSQINEGGVSHIACGSFVKFAIKDRTDSPFVQIISPNGGETYQAGQPITIKWRTRNIPESSKGIVLSLHKDGEWKDVFTLSNETLNNGNETFIIPDVEPGNYKVRIGYSLGDAQEDFSDDFFTISNEAPSFDK